MQALMADWKQTVRPLLPGRFVEMIGAPKDRPGEMVFLALAQDEATYRALAELPEQQAFYQRMIEHTEGEPTWEDVSMEIVVQD
jgi:hypothetical protein